jgi:hypothetical protein
MQAAQALYGQNATHLVLRLFLRPETDVGGALVAELAQTFLSDLVLPGCRLTSLDTKRPGIGPKLNMGEFSDRRWQAAVKKILAGEYAVAGIKAQTPASPDEQIWLTTHVNPPGTEEGRVSGTVEVMMSVSYLRRLVALPEKWRRWSSSAARRGTASTAGPPTATPTSPSARRVPCFPSGRHRVREHPCRGNPSRRPPSARMRSRSPTSATST